MHIDGITLAGQIRVKRANVSERHSNTRDNDGRKPSCHDG